LHIFELLFDCFISRLCMRVSKIFLGKNILLRIFLKFQIFSVKRPDGPPLGLYACGSVVRTEVTHPNERGSAKC
jgi:hypothetical protein